MNLKNTITYFWILFIGLFFSVNSYAQKGALEIFVNNQTDENVNGVVEIVGADGFVRMLDLDFFGYESVLDSLEIGFYNVKIISKDGEDKTQVIENVLVKKNQTTVIYYSLPTIDYENEEGDTAIENKGYFVLQYSNGNYFINKNKFFNSYYGFGLAIEGTNSLTKQVSILQGLGSVMNWTYFDSNNSISPDFTKRSEKYFYWYFNYKVLIRLTSYDNKRWRTKGVFMDFGASYNFPLKFDYVLSEGNTRTKTNHIHRYNDFSAIIRAGYLPFSFTFEYRLTNFLDEIYPEQPKMKLGLTFVFG